jgi:hypothetical protein
MTSRRRRESSERGAELVEFALVLPLLLAIVAGIIDFGLLFQRQLVLNNAAREGARIAVLPGYAQADVAARVSVYLGAGLGGASAVLSCDAPGSEDVAHVCLATTPIDPPGATPPFNAAQVTVRMQHTYLVLGPILRLLGGTGAGFGTIITTAVSTMRLEVG